MKIDGNIEDNRIAGTIEQSPLCNKFISPVSLQKSFIFSCE